MADKIVLTNAEKKIKERCTVDSAKRYVGTCGWLIALWPFFLTLVMLIEIIFDLNLPNSINLVFAVVLMILVQNDIQYMRAFFDAKFRRGAWTAGTFFMGPVSCAYLFMRPKHIKNDKKLKDVMHAQAVVSLIGWIGSIMMTLVYLIMILPGIWQGVPVSECWDPEVKTLFVEIIEENNNVSNVKVDKFIEQSFKDGVRVCNALDVTYTDLDDYMEKRHPAVKYTVRLVDAEDGKHVYVNIPEQ